MTALTFPAEPTYVLRNTTVARTLLARPQSYPGEDETVQLDLAVERGRVVRITPAGSGEGGPTVDLDGGMVWPCFTDIHTHLDKGHIWPRCPNRTLVGSRRRRAHEFRAPLRLRARHARGAHAYRQHW